MSYRRSSHARLMAGVAFCTLTASAVSLAAPGQAFAQPAAPAQEAAPQELQEVVVTGTLVRGVAPPGTNVIGVNNEAIQETGATTTTQLLQTIPQFGAFNTLAAPVGQGNTITTNRPNLRSLPGFNNSGGSTTLVLMDGRRIVGAGITSTSPDPDVIPPGGVDRVEVVPDGGSAIYGSDAVAGVLNFQTRKRFQGLEVSARYGVAADYNQADFNITGGKSWTDGSAYLSYNYAEHDAIFGRDRDYVRQFPIQTLSGLALTSIQCAPGNVVQGGRVFALPFTTATPVAGTANQCDASDDVTVYPRESRHSVLGSIIQDFSDTVQLELKGFYTQRELDLTSGPFRFTQAVANAAASPFFVASIGNNQNISGALGARNAQRQNIDLETWGLLPTLTMDLTETWQMRVLGSYSESRTTNHAGGLNTAALTNATRLGLFNPYAPASSDPATLALLTNYETFGETKQRLADLRVVFDGDVFTLPGGAVKMAVGGEVYHERFITRKGETVPGYERAGFPGVSVGTAVLAPAIASLPEANLSRTVRAVFGEVVVPIFSSENAIPWVRELTFSAAARYDQYSDFGDTTNPKVGLTYRPLDWVKLRASWGKSFVAPSLADAPQSELTQIIQVPAAGFAPPPALVQNGTYPAVQPGQFVYGIRGNSPNIQPQKAETISYGIEVQPPIVPGLSVDLSYYKIDFEGVIGLPPVGGPATATLYRDYPFLVQTRITDPQVITNLLAQSSTPVNACVPLPGCVYSILDIRKRNLGNFKLSGLDLNARYVREMGFGQLTFQVGGTYELNREQSAAPGLPFSDLLAANNERLRLRTSVAAEIGDLLAQVTWNHTSGYDLDPAAGLVAPLQTSVDAFNVVNLFFRYEFKGDGALNDLSVTLNVDNVFDAEPPEFRGVTSTTSASGYENGNTLGRLFQVGVQKRF